MKIIAFLEARQDRLIRKILQHCGLWQEPKPRPPPRPPPIPMSRSQAAPTLRPRLPYYDGRTPMADLDAEFLEHLHQEAQPEQLDLPWD